MIEQIILIVLFIFILKGISKLYDRPYRPQPEEFIPEAFESSETRYFNWVFYDNIRSYSLRCEVAINEANVQEAKKEFLSIDQPSKIILTSDEECFNIANIEILHDKFGVGSYEIEQITEYLKNYANSNYLSNYQFAILILSFVHEQNIKYSYDEDSTGYLEYFRFPLETIYDKTGDCDCKAILASALFKKLGFRVAFALMPGHAALAISTESTPFFGNFQMNGTSWFYCESTGDNWKPGEIPNNVISGQVILREI